MRKLFAIALLALLGLPFAAPLLAATTMSASTLPACCRRDGRHHCMAMMTEAGSATVSVRAPRESCPYCPAQAAVPHLPHFGLAASQAIFASVVNHPSVHAQTASQQRVSQDRARQKRGPPDSLQG
ncbi:DUF2946 family protein [Silvibacterium acidisoli]|uniref:DUF2946 family protein n=1 Tax=Acidobacteriaceae bacterium ZG23-2 TaxID=2883246 RepID=UPI00406CA583